MLGVRQRLFEAAEREGYRPVTGQDAERLGAAELLTAPTVPKAKKRAAALVSAIERLEPAYRRVRRARLVTELKGRGPAPGFGLDDSAHDKTVELLQEGLKLIRDAAAEYQTRLTDDPVFSSMSPECRELAGQQRILRSILSVAGDVETVLTTTKREQGVRYMTGPAEWDAAVSETIVELSAARFTKREIVGIVLGDDSDAGKEAVGKRLQRARKRAATS